MSVDAVRARLAMREWPLLGARTSVLLYMLPIAAIALVSSVIAVADVSGGAREWATMVGLIALAIAFEEGSRRAARLQFRLSSELHADMTSVWAVAVAVALSPGMAVILLASVFVYDWYRQWRPAGEALYRKLFVACTGLLGCLAAGILSRDVAHAVGGLPWALAGAVPIFVAIVVYTSVNRLLVTVVLVLSGLRGRALLGSKDENLIELATLCLGGLVGLAVVHQPWLAVLVVAPMVTLQRGALVRELETAATTDSKTGLLNAVAWEQLAQRELSRATREQYSIAVLIVDIDRFKLVNDRYGHLVGDAVLRGVGRSLTAAMREYDTVARFGGEEFVAVLPEADVAVALVVAERVRATVNELYVSGLVEGLEPIGDDRLAVSIGVACMPLHGDELPELLHGADQALYRAKESGRNQVQLAHDGGGERPAPVSVS